MALALSSAQTLGYLMDKLAWLAGCGYFLFYKLTASWLTQMALEEHFNYKRNFKSLYQSPNEPFTGT